jgi:hypothetical protein
VSAHMFDQSTEARCRIHPRFHPRNSWIHGDTGRQWPNPRTDKALADGTIRHQMDARRPTHNPWVVGSIPTRPTTAELGLCPILGELSLR